MLEQPLPSPSLASPAAQHAPPPPASAGERLLAIDQVRGLVIVLMVLDHVRDFFSNAQFSPTDLAKTTPALFLTRWITHFCAPAFVFLAGTSAFLAGRKLSRPALSRFLASRGLWLIVVEFTVVSFAWSFNLDYRMGLVMQVIWAIGASMCCLSLLVWLPLGAVATLGGGMIAAHNLLDAVTPESWGPYAPLFTLLHVQARIPIGFVVYPLIPWVGVMCVGYAFGALYARSAAQRNRLTLGLGAAGCAVFIALRALNGYGDPAPWSPQSSGLFTTLSFLNVSKYPPSLAYLLMTLGPMLLALWALERWPRAWLAPLVTFGRVPLFAYVVHLLIAHITAGALGALLGYGPVILGEFPFFYPPDWGFSLPWVYAAWGAVLFCLYPACHWFAGVKGRRKDFWLKYL